jgi:hypothetical protein
MPITVEWDNPEKTVVRMTMIGKWTWDEAYAGAAEGYALLESVDYEVGVILDMTQTHHTPDRAITNAQAMIKRRHPRTGLTVFVRANTLFTTMWNIFSRLYTVLAHKQNSVFAQTLDEARAILAKAYPPPAKSAPTVGTPAE